MPHNFNQLFQATILEINNSNRMLAREAQKEAEKAEHEQQHQATEDDVEREALDFND